jgi:hypothetical protein
MNVTPLDDSRAAIDEAFPMPEIDSNGVDRSQIRRQLMLTPSERLKALETFLASILEIRRAIRRAPISTDPPASGR